MQYRQKLASHQDTSFFLLFDKAETTSTVTTFSFFSSTFAGVPDHTVNSRGPSFDRPVADTSHAKKKKTRTPYPSPVHTPIESPTHYLLFKLYHRMPLVELLGIASSLQLGAASQSFSSSLKPSVCACVSGVLRHS